MGKRLFLVPAVNKKKLTAGTFFIPERPLGRYNPNNKKK